MSLVIQIGVRCRTDALGAQLIEHAAPTSSPELALRAQRLTSIEFRDTLAGRLQSAVGLQSPSRAISRALTSAVVMPPGPLAQLAAPAARRLASHLREIDDPEPRGVALALRLVRDGASPLNVGPSIDDVLNAIAEIKGAL